jgi:TonB family protein
MMNSIHMALGILLATLIAGPAWSQEQSAPPARVSQGTPPVAQADQTAPATPAQPPMKIRVGGPVEQAKLLYAPRPAYPADAKAAHISGTVTIHGIIAADGTVRSMEVISGPEVLKQAAIDAVKQWRYRPMLLNGKPVEVDTKIDVLFSLDPSPEAPTEKQAGPAPPATGAIDPQFKADILRLLEVMDVQGKVAKMSDSIFASVRPAVVSSLPATPNREKIADAYLEKLTRMLSSSELTDRIAVIYANYFTDDDVKALADFFQTPAGRHFNDASAQLFSAGNDAGQALAREHVPDILRSLCEEYPELQGEAKFCPDESKEKKGQLNSPDRAPATASASLR